jgi:HEPN domain-containing protein
MAGDSPLPDIVAFHCQQAAEKALKAYLAWRNQPFRRTHDLRELVEQCAGLSPDFASLRAAAPLHSPTPGPRATRRRSGPTVEQAEAAHRFAQGVVDFVLARLPADLDCDHLLHAAEPMVGPKCPTNDASGGGAGR